MQDNFILGFQAKGFAKSALLYGVTRMIKTPNEIYQSLLNEVGRLIKQAEEEIKKEKEKENMS